MFNSIEEALTDIKSGKMVIVVDDEDRENEGDLVMAASRTKAEDINFMAKYGRGLICAPLDASIAERLRLDPMVTRNTERAGTNFTVSIDYRHATTTGISAADRAKTVRAISSLKSSGDDFLRPGHVFPLIARKGGVLVRAGHTEAATDLASMAGLSPAAVICEIMTDDGKMARLPFLTKFAELHGIKMIMIRDLIAYRRKSEKLVKKEAESLLPTKYGEMKISIYKSIIDDKDYIAIVHGKINSNEIVTVRVHSECITGEVFSSLRCDCGEQLQMAFKAIAKAGKGVLLYLRQEGRGIGLINKIKAYNLQDQGYDTVEANRKLGFGDDLREYGLGAQILVDMGIKKINLLTNNPRKIIGIEGYGIKVVKRIPLQIRPNKRNLRYLISKKRRLGHLLTNI